MKPNIGQGDKGETSLFGGKKVSKDDYQVRAYGNVDELNSFVGMVRSANVNKDLDMLLEKIQEDLFVLGSRLAFSGENQNLPRLTQDNVRFIEDNIQKFEKDLPELRKFILPTGSQTASLMHVVRSICRRTERGVVALAEQKKIDENVIPYINRLSDLFFVLGRWVNKQEGKQEKEWISG